MDGHCPSCTRFIGPEDTCPYCHDVHLLPSGLRMARRLVIPVAILLVSGMTLLASHLPLPVLTGNEISPLMNHARVSLEGVIRYKPQIREEPVASIYIPLQSGNQRVRLRAYKSAALSLTGEVNGLKRGDRILATGSLSLSHGRDPVLYLDQISTARTR